MVRSARRVFIHDARPPSASSRRASRAVATPGMGATPRRRAKASPSAPPSRASAMARLDAIARGATTRGGDAGGGATTRDDDDDDARARALEPEGGEGARKRAFEALRAIEGALDEDESGSEDGWDDDAGRDAGDGFGDDSSDDRESGRATRRGRERGKRAVRAVGGDDGRLRMRGPIEMEGEEYAGRSASRRDFARDEPEAARETDEDESDDDDGDDGDDDEESAEEDGDASDEDPYADEDDDAYEGYDEDAAATGSGRRNGGDEDDEDEDDEDQSDEFDAQGARARDLLGAATEGDADLARELQAFREEEEQTKKLVDTKAQHVSKGKAVRAQRTVWERALHARIRLQKVMTGAAKLPTALACRGLKRASPETRESFETLSKVARKTMRTLSALQTALMANIADIASTSNLGADATVIGVDDDLDDAWTKHDAGYRAFANYRDSTCDRWYRKSAVSVGKAVGGGAGGGLKAFNQSISQQVSSTMRAPARLIEKSQPPKRSAPIRVGERRAAVRSEEADDDDENKAETVNVDGLDEGEARESELYDDVDFYEQLLKEFLESGNDAGVAGGPSVVSKQIKRRKNVDRKASKGRKIRYHVQEPLVNFTQANDVEIPAWAERVFSQLFASSA